MKRPGLIGDHIAGANGYGGSRKVQTGKLPNTIGARYRRKTHRAGQWAAIEPEARHIGCFCHEIEPKKLTRSARKAYLARAGTSNAGQKRQARFTAKSRNMGYQYGLG